MLLVCKALSTACECLWCRAPDKPLHGCWTATSWNMLELWVRMFFPPYSWDLGYFNCTVAVRQERALKKAAQVLFEDQRKSYNSATWHEELATVAEATAGGSNDSGDIMRFLWDSFHFFPMMSWWFRNAFGDPDLDHVALIFAIASFDW
jgi:hypothetical protein